MKSYPPSSAEVTAANHASVDTLLTLLSDPDAHGDLARRALEVFVAGRLADAGVWGGPRQSDGVADHRVVAVDESRARICGRIWEIAQVRHVFWLDLERHGPPHAWTLYFGVDPTSCRPRFERHAHELLGDPSGVDWIVVLSGEAP